LAQEVRSTIEDAIGILDGKRPAKQGDEHPG
jgi:hypothetical protein